MKLAPTMSSQTSPPSRNIAVEPRAPKRATGLREQRAAIDIDRRARDELVFDQEQDRAGDFFRRLRRRISRTAASVDCFFWFDISTRSLGSWTPECVS